MFKHTILKHLPRSALAVFAAAFWLGSSHAALAASASTLGGMFCNLITNAEPFGKLFQWVAYVFGAIAALQGVHHMRMHTEDARNNPLNRPLMLWAGSACLLALPKFMGAIENSLFTPSGGGLAVCSAVTPTVSANGLEGMLTGFVTNIKAPLLDGISLVAILCGLFMMIRGLMKASKYGFDPKTNSMHSVLTHIGFGAMLFSIGDNLNMMLSTVFGTQTIASTTLSWANLPSGTSTEFTTAVSSALIFVQLIGTIGFVRGWLIMKKVVEGGGNVTLAQGLSHIIGGVLAINIGSFLTLMDATFGTGLLNQ